MLQNKKHVFIAVLLSLISMGSLQQSASAQTVLLDPPEVYIGTKHGLTGSMINFDPKVVQKPLFCYNGGLAFRYITEKHVGLQIEVNYSERGWAEESEDYSRKLTYLELPFLTHIYFGKTNRFIFNLGPKISYLLSESEIVNNIETPTADQHINSVYFPFDYGITAGLGYNLHTRKLGVFELEVRAYYGLSDVFANTSSNFFRNSNHLNASVNLAWYLQLTGKNDKKRDL